MDEGVVSEQVLNAIPDAANFSAGFVNMETSRESQLDKSGSAGALEVNPDKGHKSIVVDILVVIM